MCEMTLNEYQSKAHKFAAYTHCDYPFVALAEEAGEVLGKLAKYGRKQGVSVASAVKDAAWDFSANGHTLHEDLTKELGDVLWQLQQCCVELNVTLEEVAIMNLNKLSGRADRGTIVGEGDER